MRRGSTPTFTVNLPTFASSFQNITVTMVQGVSNILTIPHSRLAVLDKKISFTLTENETLLFDHGVKAELQIRAVDRFGQVLISDIRSIAIRKKYPEDI